MLPPDHPRLKRRPLSQGELVADGVVHAFAILAALVGITLLIALVVLRRGPHEVTAVAIYGLAMLTMFGFSAAYNLVPPSSLKWLLRRFDHSAIFVMIAGTYMPLLVLMKDGFWAMLLGSLVWAGALAGCIMKLAFPGRYDRISIMVYVLLGSSALLAMEPLSRALPPLTLWLMAVGGLVYVAGIGFYVWKSLRFNNAIWHSFVATAAGLHYAGITHAMVQ